MYVWKCFYFGFYLQRITGCWTGNVHRRPSSHNWATANWTASTTRRSIDRYRQHDLYSPRTQNSKYKFCCCCQLQNIHFLLFSIIIMFIANDMHKFVRFICTYQFMFSTLRLRRSKPVSKIEKNQLNFLSYMTLNTFANDWQITQWIFISPLYAPLYKISVCVCIGKSYLLSKCGFFYCFFLLTWNCEVRMCRCTYRKCNNDNKRKQHGMIVKSYYILLRDKEWNSWSFVSITKPQA